MSTDVDPFAPATGSIPAQGGPVSRPSPKMLNYINALLAERDVPNPEALIPVDELTYADGRNMINYLLALPRRPETHVEVGWYLKDREVWWVRLGRDSGRPYAMRLLVLRDHETQEVIGSKWEFVRGGIKLLHGLPQMTKDEAIAWGAEFHVCARCGEVLTREESVARGLGPICFDKWGT